jgi:predicted MFS family arabinose efflux permease
MVGALAHRAKVDSARPLGRLQMANTSAAAVGPVVGGLLVGFVGWESLFLVNVPLALAALLTVRKAAPPDQVRERGSLAELVRDSDVPGIAGFIAALLLVMMAALNVAPDYRWWMLAAGTVVAGLFAWRELRFAKPFLNLRLLGRNRPLMLVYLAFAVFSSVYYFVFFGLPQLLQEAGGYDPGVVGLLMLPLAGMSVVATPWAVSAMGRFGVRRVLLAGVVLLTVVAALMWLLTGTLAIPVVVVLTALMGIPYGTVSIASNQGMFVSTRPQDRGVAAGLYQTCRYVGAITAPVMIGVFASSGVHQDSWMRMVLAMLVLCAVTFGFCVFWRPQLA